MASASGIIHHRLKGANASVVIAPPSTAMPWRSMGLAGICYVLACFFVLFFRHLQFQLQYALLVCRQYLENHAFKSCGVVGFW